MCLAGRSSAKQRHIDTIRYALCCIARVLTNKDKVLRRTAEQALVFHLELSKGVGVLRHTEWVPSWVQWVVWALKAATAPVVAPHLSDAKQQDLQTDVYTRRSAWAGCKSERLHAKTVCWQCSTAFWRETHVSLTHMAMRLSGDARPGQECRHGTAMEMHQTMAVSLCRHQHQHCWYSQWTRTGLHASQQHGRRSTGACLQRRQG